MKAMFVFAYGSNLLYSRIKDRVKSVEYYSTGYVNRFLLKFHKISKDGSGKANCFETGVKSDEVHGVVYKISKNDKKELDRIEGVGNGYKSTVLSIHLANTETLRCTVYLAEEDHIDDNLKPYLWYWKYVYLGAKENLLPIDYVSTFIEMQEYILDEDIERAERNKTSSVIKLHENIGGYSSYGWTTIRPKLNNSYEYSSDWEKAIKIFESRINKRYLNGLNKIPKNDYSGIGFSIVSIICILIETLSSFKNGLIHVQPYKGRIKKKYEYISSHKYFKEYLLKSNNFSPYFVRENGIRPLIDLDDFYRNVRSALIHEACTKNGWMINTEKSSKLDAEKLFTINSFSNKQINRTKLLEVIEEDFECYYNDLRSEENRELRRFFARKMDHICEIKPTDDYEWWNE